ncbi:hypothetical protein LOTGIDRAFT_169545 [Lottia gigantea]|uniref:CEP152 CEP63 binding coiled coil domain-containing protein n=1 Tax=Lottia gigantea TaxID=225164 RepID=V3YYC9_LOTGI|nr:hypothetical protein LOTGIDRAFT_169545 [Lottia gigantea]ESO83143.1 hypothetical protein LOTGIDRAFT_169545 [Lottia gigantea]
MDPGSVGTSLHFDGREVQNLQELEYQREEEQQQDELRQMLTNAFDLMDEDILSETSEENESHDGGSFQGDSSFNQGHHGDNDKHSENHRNGALYSQNDQFQHQANQQNFHPLDPSHSHQNEVISEYPQPHQVLNNRNFQPFSTTNYQQQFSSLPSNNVDPRTEQLGHVRNNHPEIEARESYPNNRPADYYTQNNYAENFNHYAETPEPHPQPDAGNGYFTENRYNFEGRSSLDISYPNPVTQPLEAPENNPLYGRTSQDFDQQYHNQFQQRNLATDHQVLRRQSQSVEDFHNIPSHQFSRTSLDQDHYRHHQNKVPHHQFQQAGQDFLSHDHPPHPNQFQNFDTHQNGYTEPTNQYQDVPHKVQYHTDDDDSLPNKRNAPEPHVLDSYSDEIQQLKILNKARAHEAEELAHKYETLKTESAREMRIFKHQMTLLEEEKERLKKLNRQLEESTKGVTEENNTLKMNLEKQENESRRLAEIREDMVKKLTAAETSIENLNYQIMDLQLSDSQNKHRQQNEMMITGLQEKFDQERLVLNEKLDKAFQVISEKEDAIDSLNKELQEERMKASLLEKNESLRGGGELYKSLQQEVQELKEQIKHSKSASRLGTFSKSSELLEHVQDDSMVDLGIRKTLHFNSTPNISHLDDQHSEKIMAELRHEIESNHSTIKKLQDLVERLQRDLTNANCHVEILRKTLESSEKTRKDGDEIEKRLQEMVENEEKLITINNDLNQKLGKLEEETKNMVTQSELDTALQELDKIKEMYVTECEEREKQERQLWTEYEDKLKTTKDSFTETEKDLHKEIQNLQMKISAKEEIIKEMEIKQLTAKYSKPNDSSFVENLNSGPDEKLQTKTEAKSLPGLPKNKHEKAPKDPGSDDSKDSSLNNSFLKNLTCNSEKSFEKSDDSRMSSCSKSSMAERAMKDIKKQHQNEIEYVRNVLIEENKTMSVEFHQKMLEMRESHKNYIQKLKQDFRMEKEAMVTDFEKKQQIYLNHSKPNSQLVAQLQSQYLETLNKIKSTVLKHVKDSNLRAAERLKHELCTERRLDKAPVDTTLDGTLQE